MRTVIILNVQSKKENLAENYCIIYVNTAFKSIIYSLVFIYL